MKLGSEHQSHSFLSPMCLLHIADDILHSFFLVNLYSVTYHLKQNKTITTKNTLDFGAIQASDFWIKDTQSIPAKIYDQVSKNNLITKKRCHFIFLMPASFIFSQIRSFLCIILLCTVLV